MMTSSTLFLVYIALVNFLCFMFFAVDKRRAIRGKWRIKESTLVTIGALGGSLGGILAMKLFHHKTKHRKFALLFPLFFVVHCILFILLWK